MSLADLQRNIAARKEAQQIIDAFEGNPLRFWEVLRDECLRRAPLPQLERLGPMTEQQAQDFERETMPFGKYAGVQFTTIGEIYEDDPGYLDWLASHDFHKRLTRYLMLRNKTQETDDDD